MKLAVRHVFGDNENGIQFPSITICNQNYYLQNPLMKKCLSIEPNTWDLLGSLNSCMKEDPNFTIDSFMDSIELDIRNIVALEFIWTGSKNVYLNEKGNLAWSIVFHYAFGPCYLFDLSRIEEYKYISYKERMRPGLAFVITETNPWKKVFVLVHTEVDRICDSPF